MPSSKSLRSLWHCHNYLTSFSVPCSSVTRLACVSAHKKTRTSRDFTHSSSRRRMARGHTVLPSRSTRRWTVDRSTRRCRPCKRCTWLSVATLSPGPSIRTWVPSTGAVRSWAIGWKRRPSERFMTWDVMLFTSPNASASFLSCSSYGRSSSYCGRCWQSLWRHLAMEAVYHLRVTCITLSMRFRFPRQAAV